MSKLYSVTIRWLDDDTEQDVLIAESHGIGDLPESYCDDDIFFYGMRKENIINNMERAAPCENQWTIIAFNGEIN